MKSFLNWFRPGLKLKRWLILILIGIVMLVYSVSTIMVENTPEIKTIAWVIVFFILGFLLVIYGIINLQKRTLEIFVEVNGVNSKRLKDQNISMNSLIFDRNVYENGPKVVVIGGGTGLNSVISGIKKYTTNITAIVTLSDYQKDDSRKELNLLPYSDIKESIAALSDEEDVMSKLLKLNFSSDRLKGLNFGDVYLLAMQELYGNVSTSIKKSTDVLNIKGEVVPVSLDEISVNAELTDGTNVESKERIPEVVMEKIEAIKRIYIKPTNARPTPRALEAIEEADIIVLGPGNLYTNIIPNILVKNIAKAIKSSKALKVYVANIMTDQGQTDGYTLSDHIQAIFDHANDKIFDFCVCDTGDIVPEYIRLYNKKGEDVVVVDSEEVKRLGVKLIQKDLSKVDDNGKIRHDPDAIAVAVMDILLSDIKYSENKDKMTHTVLNSVLKEQKRIQRKKEKRLEKARKRGKTEEEIAKMEEKPKRRSKYSEKYRKRFENIQAIDRKKEKEEEKLKKELSKARKNIKDIEKDKEKLLERAKYIVEQEKDEGIQVNKEQLGETEKISEFDTAYIKVLTKEENKNTSLNEVNKDREKNEEFKETKRETVSERKDRFISTMPLRTLSNLEEKAEKRMKDLREGNVGKERKSDKELKDIDAGIRSAENKAEAARRKAEELMAQLNKLEQSRLEVREEIQNETKEKED